LGDAIVAACRLALLLTLLPIGAVAAAAEAEVQGRDDDDSASSLKKLSIAELLNIEVTSVSKTAEPLSDAAAALYVITRDDILRSGATSIPDMLRLAPNLQLAQITASTFAITARGFNGPAASKLLVLIDGRSVYTPFHSGSVVGRPGRTARRHRAHRSDPRSRRDVVGRQCSQRRHQHNHAQFRTVFR